MARRECDGRNSVRLRDNLSNSDIVLYYRLPTTSERQEYHNASVVRRKNDVEVLTTKARLESGMKILTGFEVGSFERKVGGEYVQFSSDEDDPDFFSGWREWVRENANDLVILMAARVFDAPSSLPKDDEDSIEEK